MLELPSQDRDEISVLGCFAPQYNITGGRVVLGIKGRKDKRRPRKGDKEKEEMLNANENDVEADGDVEMGNGNEQGQSETSGSGQGNWVTTLAASSDGQWLAAGDFKGGVTVYNLDTMQVSYLVFDVRLGVSKRLPS